MNRPSTSSVAGTPVPAFVERGLARDHPLRRRRVAGTPVPAFVERGSWPGPRRGWPGVAGTPVPAFVERASCPARRTTTTPVLPGPRFRPSLSGLRGRPRGRRLGRVAGTPVPAFVERTKYAGGRWAAGNSVAGTPVPAFVERSTSRYRDGERCVLPGPRFRPSLSGIGFGVRIALRRRVAGTPVPAFVERASWNRQLPPNWGVLPGPRFRPSLSDEARPVLPDVLGSVAGTSVPALDWPWTYFAVPTPAPRRRATGHRTE